MKKKARMTTPSGRRKATRRYSENRFAVFSHKVEIIHSRRLPSVAPYAGEGPGIFLAAS